MLAFECLTPRGILGKQASIVVAVTDKELRDKLSEINAEIGGWKKDFDPFYGAPAILIVLADNKPEGSGKSGFFTGYIG